MVFGLSGADALLLRWKIIDVIQMKESIRRVARQIRLRQYENLDVIVNEMQFLVWAVDRLYLDLFRFLNDHNIGYVWPHLGEVWDNFNILALDFRWV